VLTYIGFDGISTLSEEVENPRRNIMFATVLTCLIIGILSASKCMWRNWCGRLRSLFRIRIKHMSLRLRAHGANVTIVGLTLLVANFGSGMGAQIGAARLLYGMGRSNALPKSFLGSGRKAPRSTKQRCLHRRDRSRGILFLTFEQGDRRC